jgi:hypothetical protein
MECFLSSNSSSSPSLALASTDHVSSPDQFCSVGPISTGRHSYASCRFDDFYVRWLHLVSFDGYGRILCSLVNGPCPNNILEPVTILTLLCFLGVRSAEN